MPLIGKNPALAEKLLPALREIHGLVGQIPKSALDALPTSARQSLERMKGQLDELFGKAANKVDDVAIADHE